MPDDTPDEGYDALAARADAIDGTGTPWGENPFQAHYSWPATRDLLPDVNDRRVLDAGCGVGDHVGWLLDRGAEVVGVDASAAAVETARDRFGDRADFHHADLADPLPLADDSFDVVLSHLVLDHVPDLAATLAELRRVLADGGERAEGARPSSDQGSDGGTLVFTIVHPVRFHHEHGVRYYDAQPVEIEWPGATTVAHHRPVGSVVDAVLDAGLRLDTLDEPEPLASYAEHAPDRYETARERPQVLCVRATA